MHAGRRFAPALVALSLAAALLIPDPDQATLQAQGISRLLAEAPPLLLAVPDAAGTALSIAGPDGVDLAEDPAVGRALASAINVANTERRALGKTELAITGDGQQQLALALSEQPAGLVLNARLEGEGGAQDLGTRGPWPVPTRAALLPALVAIGVALVLRRTITALFCGILIGAVLLRLADGVGLFASLGLGFLDVFTRYLLGELTDSFRIEIIGFVAALVAMVGVVSRGGGVQGLVELIVRFAQTTRSTLCVSFGMGCMIFFDDYSNCLIVGNTMRPLTDRLRISREKLAYVVDSTAAPVAGLSLLSTWIAFEVSTYAPQLPAAGIMENPYAVFLQTLPFRFYCLFTLGFVLMNALSGRDFGPMRAAEERARRTGELVRADGTPMVSSELTRIEPTGAIPFRARNAAVPIGVVIAVTFHEIFRRGGGYASDPDALLSLAGWTDILFAGSGGGPVFAGATAGLAVAVLMLGSNAARIALALAVAAAAFATAPLAAALGALLEPALANYAAIALVAATVLAVGVLGLRRWVPTRRPHLDAAELLRSALSSTRALGFAVVILFQAWMIGRVCQDIGTADYLVALTTGAVSAVWLPVLLFGVACLVSFATGTSWGTMSILLPNVVGLAAAVGASHPIGAFGLVLVSIGAVLEGSIFGDHCSPISDTTVLSSVATASDHVDHVRTQIPYALLTAAAAVAAGYLPTLLFPFWSLPLALLTGFGALAACLWLFGRPAGE